MTFSPQWYSDLLSRLIRHYGHVTPACPPFPKYGVMLRHDVDLLLTPSILQLAEIEEQHGVRSCWFIRTDGHYNPLSSESRAVLNRLQGAGHKIGVHYNCENATLESLERDRWILRHAVPTTDAITGHRPTLAARDPFRMDPCNPGSTEHGYVADSKRRPLVLPDALPPLLQANVHPEHYVTDLPLAQHYAALAEELTVSLAA